MTTKAQLRKAALALPEVEEGTHFGMPAFSVRGKGFATIAKDGCVQLRLHDGDSEAALAANPTGERLVRMGTPIGISIPLADIDGQALNALVRSAWVARAPTRLATALVAADAQTASGVGDLPTAIGKPAARALFGAGLNTLDDVATRSEAELLDLHGVGPKAVRLLIDALDARGMSLR